MIMSGEALENSITKFPNNADVNSTFFTRLARLEDIINEDFQEQTGICYKKKMGLSEHEKCSNYILPRHPPDCSFVETVKTLKQMFSEHTSFFSGRFNSLNITKCDTVDLMTFAGTVNKECEGFKISSITGEQYKCLIFVYG